MQEINLPLDLSKSDRLAKAALAVFGVALALAFSPLIAFFLGVALLYFLRCAPEDLEGGLIAAISLVAASAIVASRQIAVSDSDDMIRYYELFLQANQVGYFQDSSEVVIRVFYSFLQLSVGEVSVKIFVFMHCLVVCLLFLRLIYMVMERPHIKLDSRFVAVAILMFSYFMTTQLFRFFVAVLLLTFILAIKNRVAKLFVFCFSALVHLASPIVFLIYRFGMRRFSAVSVVAILSVLLVSLNFTTFASYIINTELPGANKLEYPLYIDGFDTPSVLSLVSVSFSLLIVLVFMREMRNSDVEKLTRALVMVLIIGTILLPWASLPMRLLFPITAIYNALILGIVIPRFSIFTSSLLFGSLFIYKAYAFSGIAQNPNFMLWSEYDQFGLIPFYYLY